MSLPCVLPGSPRVPQLVVPVSIQVRLILGLHAPSGFDLHAGHVTLSLTHFSSLVVPSREWMSYPLSSGAACGFHLGISLEPHAPAPAPLPTRPGLRAQPHLRQDPAHLVSRYAFASKFFCPCRIQHGLLHLRRRHDERPAARVRRVNPLFTSRGSGNNGPNGPGGTMAQRLDGQRHIE
jgi:hypothetical protein